MGQTAVADAVAHHNNVVLVHRADTIFHFVAKFAGLENHHLEMIRPVQRYVMPAIQDQEANVDRIRVGERPDVIFLRVDLAVDKRIDALPGHASFRSNGHFALRTQ